VRQLSAPCRLAAALAASLALAATAGCMSVSDHKSGKPAPTRPAGPKAAPADHEAVPPVGPGVRYDGGHRARPGPLAPGGRRVAVPAATPSPSGGSAVPQRPSATPTRGAVRPHQPPGPQPTPAGPTPTVTPEPPVQEPTPEPPASEPATTPPPEPTDPPSASSAPEVHAGALRMARVDGTAGGVPYRAPAASPQAGPV
jgi:hypothetical protein